MKLNVVVFSIPEFTHDEEAPETDRYSKDKQDTEAEDEKENEEL